MENRYSLQVLKYDGTSDYKEIEADTYQIQEGVIKFLSDGGPSWITIAVYPADKTIISKIQKIK